MARKPTTWTDREVARILEARARLALAERGDRGFAEIQPLSKAWLDTEYEFLCAAIGATRSRPSARRALQALARRINQTPVNWFAAGAGPTNPEAWFRRQLEGLEKEGA
jgi:hypothetical protein